MSRSRWQAHGFSLVELLIAQAISLFLIAGMISLLVGQMRTQGNSITSMAQEQQLRGILQVMSRDLRRAAGDDWRAQLDPAMANAPALRLLDRSGDGQFDCVLYRRPEVTGNRQWNGFRLHTGQRIQMKGSGTGVEDACSEGYWLTMNEPNLLPVTQFSLQRSGSSLFTIAVASETVNHQVTVALPGALVEVAP